MLAGRESWSPGALVVTLRSGSITVAPRERVAFLPVPEGLPAETTDAGTAALLSGRTLAQAGRYAATLQVHAQLRDAPPFFVVDAPSWLAAARVTLPYDKQEYATLAGNQLVFAQQSAVRELWVVKNFAKK